MMILAEVLVSVKACSIDRWVQLLLVQGFQACDLNLRPCAVYSALWLQSCSNASGLFSLLLARPFWFLSWLCFQSAAKAAGCQSDACIGAAAFAHLVTALTPSTRLMSSTGLCTVPWMVQSCTQPLGLPNARHYQHKHCKTF